MEMTFRVINDKTNDDGEKEEDDDGKDDVEDGGDGDDSKYGHTHMP